MNSKALLVLLFGLLAVGLFAYLTLAPPAGTPADRQTPAVTPHELPDFSNAPFTKVNAGVSQSYIHPEWGAVQAVLYSNTGTSMEPGGTYVVTFLNEDGSYKYAEELVVAADGKSGVMSGFTYADGKFTFEKGEVLTSQAN